MKIRSWKGDGWMCEAKHDQYPCMIAKARGSVEARLAKVRARAIKKDRDLREALEEALALLGAILAKSPADHGPSGAADLQGEDVAAAARVVMDALAEGQKTASLDALQELCQLLRRMATGPWIFYAHPLSSAAGYWDPVCPRVGEPAEDCGKCSGDYVPQNQKPQITCQHCGAEPTWNIGVPEEGFLKMRDDCCPERQAEVGTIDDLARNARMRAGLRRAHDERGAVPWKKRLGEL